MNGLTTTGDKDIAAPLPRLYLRPDEAARVIGVSRRTLSAWQSARVIGFRRVGRTILFSVTDNCLRVVHEAAGRLVVGDFAARNVERFETFARIAAATGRRLLVQPKDAYLLRAVHLADPTTPDLMTSVHVAVYDDPKSVCRQYEKAVRQRYANKVVTPAEVRRHLGDHILAFSLTDMADLLDLEYLVGHELNGVYVYSNGPAYDDEQKVDLLRLWNWVQHLGFTLIGLQPRHDVLGKVVAMDIQPGYHASGHAGCDELREFVHRVAPRTLIPVHTDAVDRWAELLSDASVQMVLPRANCTISLRRTGQTMPSTTNSV